MTASREQTAKGLTFDITAPLGMGPVEGKGRAYAGIKRPHLIVDVVHLSGEMPRPASDLAGSKRRIERQNEAYGLIQRRGVD